MFKIVECFCSVHGSIGYDKESFQVGCRLGREIFTLSLYCNMPKIKLIPGSTPHWGPGPSSLPLASCSLIRRQRLTIIQPFKSVVHLAESLPAVVGYLDQNYRYKSVASQILHDDELTPIPDRKILLEWRPIHSSTSTKQYSSYCLNSLLWIIDILSIYAVYLLCCDIISEISVALLQEGK